MGLSGGRGKPYGGRRGVPDGGFTEAYFFVAIAPIPDIFAGLGGAHVAQGQWGAGVAQG